MSNVYTTDYTDDDNVTSRTVTSEATNFDDDNLYNGVRRSKVWRSAGYFNVTSSNNTIIFDEDGGGDLTATIAVAEYTTIASFLAAVKTALEAVGGGTYTVAQNSSNGNKVRISVTSVTNLTLKWSDASTTAEDLLGFDDSADDTGGDTYDADYLRIHTNERFVWDLGSPANPKAFAAISRKGRDLGISSSATITLMGNTTNNFSSPEYSATITWNNLGLFKSSSTGLHTSELRYWALDIVDQDNQNNYIELSNVFLGDMVVPTQGGVQFPLNSGFRDLTRLNVAVGGQVLADPRENVGRFTLQWAALNSTDKELIDTHWENVQTHKPFFIQLDPDAVYSSSNKYYGKFVRFSGEPDWSLIAPNIFTYSMQLEEVL